MKSISTTIRKQSLKETVLFLVISTIIFSCVIGYISYVKFFEMTEKIVNISVLSIARSLHTGDEFSIKSELSFLLEKEGFYDVWVEDSAGYKVGKMNDNYDIFSDARRINFLNISYQYKVGNVFLIQKFALKDSLGNLFVVQNINIINLFFKYLIMLVCVLILSAFIRWYRIKTYKMFTDSIINFANRVRNNNNEHLIISVNPKVEYKEIFELYEEINKYYIRLKENEKNKIKISELKSVVNTIQMLAHDIRKPFSKVIAIFELAKGLNDLNQIQCFLAKYSEEIKLNLREVNGMLFDLMHFGDENELKYCTLNLEENLLQCIKECLFNETKHDIHIVLNLFHEFKLYYSSIKLDRIFINLITNALESMNYSGSLQLKTKNIIYKGASFIEFVFFNSNSYIPYENLTKIFDLHFTHNKNTGTGIGLYTVKSFVEQSGGYIRCNSNEKGVEFIFALPSSNENVSTEMSKKLSFYSSELEIHSKQISSINLEQIKNSLVGKKSKSKSKDKIIIVDDEQFYLDMWRGSLNDVDVSTFKHPEIFLNYILENKEIVKNISCIILDYYYKGTKQNIVEMNFVDVLKKYGYKGACFVSSNNILSKDEVLVFDGLINKEPHTFDEIKNLFPKIFIKI